MTTTRSFLVNDEDTSANGTSFMGCITTTYDKLVELFGEPMEGSDDGKTTAEWVIEFEDGEVATIYDWKISSTPKNLHDWHVGGRSHRVLDLLEEITGIQTRASKF